MVKIKGLVVGEKSGVALHGAAANICFKVLKLAIISGVQTINLEFLTLFSSALTFAKPGKKSQ